MASSPRAITTPPLQPFRRPRPLLPGLLSLSLCASLPQLPPAASLHTRRELLRSSMALLVLLGLALAAAGLPCAPAAYPPLDLPAFALSELQVRASVTAHSRLIDGCMSRTRLMAALRVCGRDQPAEGLLKLLIVGLWQHRMLLFQD